MVQFNDPSADLNPDPALDLVFSALGDPTRRAMLIALREGEASIGALAEPHGITLAGAAKHVEVLRRAGLVTHRKVGRARLCRLEPGALKSAADWIRWHESFWQERMESLERVLEEMEDE
jgi:DNA-binding transcriptional ArsR family regulator